MWPNSELKVPAAADADAEPLPGDQTKDAAARVGQADSPPGCRERHYRNVAHATDSAADVFREAHRAEALLLFSGGDFGRSVPHPALYQGIEDCN